MKRYISISLLRVLRSTKRGFTLTEVLVSMFIFTIMMASVAQIFGTTFLAYHNIRAVQRDIDNAQFSLNILAKELRTSSVVSAAGNVTAVKFFDHSQSTCFQYRISQGSLQVASVDATSGVTDAATCNAFNFGSGAFTTISTGVITGSFQVTPSAAGVVGKVTISLDISEGSSHHARIQTSVSLRDFSLSGI